MILKAFFYKNLASLFLKSIKNWKKEREENHLPAELFIRAYFWIGLGLRFGSG